MAIERPVHDAVGVLAPGGLTRGKGNGTLAGAAGRREALGHVKRFDARYWTVNFPRPMMASVVTTAPDALRVDALFYTRTIWPG